MARINVLSKETIDKIAAGEVVERPASVVKELLENAVDAGATAVTVEIKDGGTSFIRVTDNGCGIEKEEVQKAFLRHATSKIHSADDLTHIESLGFRGEALSSISAVSKLELVSKTAKELTGLRYLIEGGEEKEAEEVGAPEGTTMIVRNLFFNTPVRRKFLKLPQTEGGYVSDLMEHMALSHPEIAFKYINNGQPRFHTSGNGSLQEIIYRIYGRDISAALLPIDVEENGIRMHGFLGKPQINRANRNFEIYFVNGRFIKSGFIGKAIDEGYRSYVMQHKFPFVVLHFEISSQEIDVNVHPTKMEVRFTNQPRLFDFISRHITAALQSTELIPEVTLEKRAQEPEKQPAIPDLPEPFEIRRAGREPVFLKGPQEVPKAVAEEGGYQAKGPSVRLEEEFFVDKRALAKAPDEKQMDEAADGQPDTEPENLPTQKPEQMNLFEERLLAQETRSQYQILGQLFGTYWLLAFQDKLFIIDQHAAHEKVKYERLLMQLKNKTIQSQMLNPPIVLSLSGREESVYREYRGFFEELGFEIEAFGGNEYALRGIPTDLYGNSSDGLFKEILDELSEGPLKGTPEAIRQRMASMACKAAVKGNMDFDRAGIEALFDQLLGLEDPYHCPHGRPTIISMSKYEIERKFKRIV